MKVKRITKWKKHMEETNLTNIAAKFAEKKMREQKKNIAANK